MSELNSTADERDPWLSPDGTMLYFSTDVSGALDLYYSVVRWE